VAELARSYTVEAIETLVDLMRHGKDERVRGTAAQALLDSGWDKALARRTLVLGFAEAVGQSFI
jgi:hypothetical protein